MPVPIDEKDVPRWAHPKLTASDLDSDDRRRVRKVTERRTLQRSTPSRDGYVLGMAIAPGATSIVGLFVAVAPRLSGTGDIPIGIVLVLCLQIAALIVLNQTALQPWTSSWISVGFLTSVMLPMLALQMSLLHEPFVSVAMGSARPVLLATLVVMGLYLSFAIWVCWVSQDRPEHAAILLMPPTLGIPALMGERGSIDQHSALIILSEVTLITAIAAAVVWLFPGWPQLLAGAGAFAAELIRLWVAGRGPWRQESSGAIVNLIYVTMLTISVLVIVLIPVAAAALSAKSRPKPRRVLARR